MGAYGAALHAKDNRRDTTTLIGTDILAGFEHNVRSTRCGLCENHCNLTINDFGGGRRFISGNRCERPLGGTKKADLPNLYKWKLEKLKSYGEPSGIANPIAERSVCRSASTTSSCCRSGRHSCVNSASRPSSATFPPAICTMQGQHSIPSDTVCYPAKLMHGHIENLLEKGVDAIFYPCMTYNLDEERATNHYNCPVVAYYPELLQGERRSALRGLRLYDAVLRTRGPRNASRSTPLSISAASTRRSRKSEVIARCRGRHTWRRTNTTLHVRVEGAARHRATRDEHDLRRCRYCRPSVSRRPGDQPRHRPADRVVRAGRRGQRGCSLCSWPMQPEVHVLNQWTYHSRHVSARRSTSPQQGERPADPAGVLRLRHGRHHDRRGARHLRKRAARYYTQLKIDEISNLGAAKIRIRSMLAAVEEGASLQNSKTTEATPAYVPAVHGGNEGKLHDSGAEHAARAASGCMLPADEELRLRHGAAAHRGSATSRSGVCSNVHNDTCYPALLVIGQLMDAHRVRQIRHPQDRAHHAADRRRLPRVQLYPPAPQGAGKERLRLHVRSFR